MKSLLYIGNKLSKQGNNPSTIEILGKQLCHEGFEVRSVSGFQNKLLRLLHMWYAICCYSNRTDLVLIDTYSTLNFWYAYTCSVLCRLLKIPYVPILHGGNLPERFKKNQKQAMCLVQYAHQTVVPSEYLYHELLSYNIPRCVIIANSIELAKYNFNQRTEFRPNLLWVRAIDPIYNPEMALQTFALVQKKFPEAQLTMVGPYKGITKDAWQEKLKKYNLPVKMTGKLTKEEWLALSGDSDIFLNTTTIDNTPVSVIEAMALGLVIVSTNVGGISYLIENDVTGLLVSNDDAEEMASAIELILLNEVKARQMAIKAREKVTQFDWQEIRLKWLQLLNDTNLTKE